MGFFLLDIGAPIALLLVYLAVVVWSDVPHRVSPSPPDGLNPPASRVRANPSEHSHVHDEPIDDYALAGAVGSDPAGAADSRVVPRAAHRSPGDPRGHERAGTRVSPGLAFGRAC